MDIWYNIITPYASNLDFVQDHLSSIAHPRNGVDQQGSVESWRGLEKKFNSLKNALLKIILNYHSSNGYCLTNYYPAMTAINRTSYFSNSWNVILLSVMIMLGL